MRRRAVWLRNWGLQQRNYLYDLIFPVFILMFFPPVILLTLGGNYIIDAAVIFIVLSANSVQLGKKKWNLITVSWALGLMVDIIGVILLMTFTGGNSYIYTIWNDRATSESFLSVVAICGVLIGFINYYLCRRRKIATAASLWTALSMAVITAPWTFLIPTSWFIHI